MKKSSSLKWFGILFALILGLDQLTKVIAIEVLKGARPIIYWGDFFRFQYAENTGAFLGLGSTLDPSVRFWVFTVLVTVVLVVTTWFIFKKNLSLFLEIGLTLIVAGGASNLIDRAFRENGGVVDFMNMGIGSLRTGIFNIADMAIMAGTFLVLIDSFMSRETQIKTKSSASSNDANSNV